MNNGDRYKEIGDRMAVVQRRRDLMQAREEEKASRREDLIRALKEQGIDTEQPSNEIVRLETELEMVLAHAEVALGQVEKELDILEGPAKAETGVIIAQPAAQEPTNFTVDDLDI